jgi:hypothetical protein
MQPQKVMSIGVELWHLDHDHVIDVYVIRRIAQGLPVPLEQLEIKLPLAEDDLATIGDRFGVWLADCVKVHMAIPVQGVLVSEQPQAT